MRAITATNAIFFDSSSGIVLTVLTAYRVIAIGALSDPANGDCYYSCCFWQSGSLQTEQTLAYFLPGDMELVVLTNSPIGVPAQFFRDVVTNIYLDNIGPEISVGDWIARHGLTSEQYQQAFNDYVGNHGMQLIDVSGYGTIFPLYSALWVKTASSPAW